MNTTNLVCKLGSKWAVRFKMYGKWVHKTFDNYWDADEFANKLDSRKKAQMLARMLEQQNEVLQGADVKITVRKNDDKTTFSNK